MICHSCNNVFPDYKSLALHISSQKKGHAKGKKWASKYLTLNSLSAKNRFEKHKSTPNTEQGKKNRQDTERPLSGETRVVKVFCPKCKHISPRSLEVEYIDSPFALREQGTLIITCLSCAGR